MGGGALPSQRPHKHVELMALKDVRRVVDLDDTEESRDCFTIIYRTTEVAATDKNDCFGLLSLCVGRRWS